MLKVAERSNNVRATAFPEYPGGLQCYVQNICSLLCVHVYFMVSINVGTLLAFLECLNVNGVSSSMQSNYLATLKAKVIIYGLPSVVFDDKK